MIYILCKKNLKNNNLKKEEKEMDKKDYIVVGASILVVGSAVYTAFQLRGVNRKLAAFQSGKPLPKAKNAKDSDNK